MFLSPASRARPGLSKQGPNEHAYWARMYNLLTPASYTYTIGTSLSLTVPANKTWYALNLWNVYINSSLNGPIFLRKANIYEAVELPAGTSITTSSSQSGFIYYSDATTVNGPPANPQEAFYARLAALKTIPLQVTTISASSGQALGTVVSANFPTTFTNGIVREVSNSDVSWTILTSTAGNSMNLLDEISDNHESRLTGALLCPFVRTTFTAIEIRVASVLGSTDLSLAGNGAVVFQALPLNW